MWTDDAVHTLPTELREGWARPGTMLAMTPDTAPSAHGPHRDLVRRAAAALLVLGLATALVGGAGAPGGARAVPTDRYVLPSGEDGVATTRAGLLASGVLVHDFAPPTVRWGPGHRGVDLRVASGSTVVAPQSGTVAFVGVVVDRPLVVVAHADGLRSTLEPVTSELAAGSVVGQGDAVGTLTIDAVTHCAPGSCVHWGVRRGEDYVDPLTLVGVREPVILLPLHRR